MTARLLRRRRVSRQVIATAAGLICTARTAMVCPVHFVCQCHVDPSESCPLHSPLSSHGHDDEEAG